MKSHPSHPDHTAARGACVAGVAWLGSGITLGLFVVDSNRPAGRTASSHPAIGAGDAGGLLMQSIAAQ